MRGTPSLISSWINADPAVDGFFGIRSGLMSLIILLSNSGWTNSHQPSPLYIRLSGGIVLPDFSNLLVKQESWFSHLLSPFNNLARIVIRAWWNGTALDEGGGKTAKGLPPSIESRCGCSPRQTSNAARVGRRPGGFVSGD